MDFSGFSDILICYTVTMQQWHCKDIVQLLWHFNMHIVDAFVYIVEEITVPSFLTVLFTNVCGYQQMVITYFIALHRWQAVSRCIIPVLFVTRSRFVFMRNQNK